LRVTDTGVPTVAVINTSHDIVEMLRLSLQHAGLVVVSALTHEIRDGHVDLERFVQQHQPAVVVYDLAPPYDANWQFCQHVRAMPALKDCQFVLTSTNPARVQALAGTDERIYEIVGVPYDLDQIIRAVKEALRARPSRSS
jgi:CheY-like chemotaxis protein